MLREQLQQRWQALAPVMQKLLSQAGIQGRAPTFDDFMWAYSVFWYAPPLPQPPFSPPGCGSECGTSVCGTIEMNIL